MTTANLPWEAVPSHEQTFVLLTGANRYVCLSPYSPHWPSHIRYYRFRMPALASTYATGTNSELTG